VEQGSTPIPGPNRRVPWSASLRVEGGVTGPRSARGAIACALNDRLEDQPLADVQLIVSELVTNSVRHAGLAHDHAITIDVLVLRDRVRVTVVDPGSPAPLRVAESELGEPGDLGLRLVERLSNSWGVAKDGSGLTRVWAELIDGGGHAD